MANIYCTKKLEKILGRKYISEIETEALIGNWNANVFYVNRKKFIFLINDQTCYSVIIPNFIKKNLETFRQVFYQRLFEQFQYDQILIDQKVRNKLLELPINFMKTNNNRKIIGTMTQFIKEIDYFLSYRHQILSLTELNNKVTDNYVSVFSEKKYEMESPITLMRNLLTKTKDKVSA